MLALLCSLALAGTPTSTGTSSSHPTTSSSHPTSSSSHTTSSSTHVTFTKAAYPAVDPGGVGTPYPRTDLVLPLDGSTQSLDITKLEHTITRFTMGADLGGLDKVTADALPGVLEALAADPRWRVVDEDGAIVAYARSQETVGGETIWTVPWAGIHRDADASWMTAIRFGTRKPDLWTKAKLVARTTTAAQEVEVQAYHPPATPTWTAVAVEWDGALAAMETFECGADEQLPHVQDALTRVPSVTWSLAVRAPTALEKGYDPAAVPKGEPVHGEPSVVVTSPGAKLLDVRARVHASSAGVAWVRLLDATGKAYEEKAVAVGTREHVGWSADPTELFWMQGTFPVPTGTAFTGTAEVWFQASPVAGVLPSPAEKLASVPVTVPKR